MNDAHIFNMFPPFGGPSLFKCVLRPHDGLKVRLFHDIEFHNDVTLEAADHLVVVEELQFLLVVMGQLGIVGTIHQKRDIAFEFALVMHVFFHQ